MCPLRTPENIAIIISFFVLFILIDVAQRFVKDPKAKKALHILDIVLYAGAFLFLASLFLRRYC